jgi:hypothetical protein
MEELTLRRAFFEYSSTTDETKKICTIEKVALNSVPVSITIQEKPNLINAIENYCQFDNPTDHQTDELFNELNSPQILKIKIKENNPEDHERLKEVFVSNISKVHTLVNESVEKRLKGKFIVSNITYEEGCIIAIIQLLIASATLAFNTIKDWGKIKEEYPVLKNDIQKLANETKINLERAIISQKIELEKLSNTVEYKRKQAVLELKQMCAELNYWIDDMPQNLFNWWKSLFGG